MNATNDIKTFLKNTSEHCDYGDDIPNTMGQFYFCWVTLLLLLSSLSSKLLMIMMTMESVAAWTTLSTSLATIPTTAIFQLYKLLYNVSYYVTFRTNVPHASLHTYPRLMQQYMCSKYSKWHAVASASVCGVQWTWHHAAASVGRNHLESRLSQ